MNRVNKGDAPGTFWFRCPGCKFVHGFADKSYEGTDQNKWEFNGDLVKPTLSPSYLLWTNKFNPASGKYDLCAHRCHSFIKNGMIQFLSDCTHELANKTVQLPDLTIPDNYSSSCDEDA